MNTCYLVGKVSKHPTFSTTGNGVHVLRFVLETTRFRNGQEVTQYHNVAAWGKLAEANKDAVERGCPVFVNGEITYKQFLKDGVDRMAVEITAFQLHILHSLQTEGWQPPIGEKNADA